MAKYPCPGEHVVNRADVTFNTPKGDSIAAVFTITCNGTEIVSMPWNIGDVATFPGIIESWQQSIISKHDVDWMELIIDSLLEEIEKCAKNSLK